jgi:hypothetical protein
MKLKSTTYLLWILLVNVIAGIIEGCLPIDRSGHSPLSFPYAILFAVLTFCWCRRHAYENNITLSHSYPAFAGLFPPLGVRTYFFRFFGFRKGGVKVLKSIGFFSLLGIGYFLPYYILSE